MLTDTQQARYARQVSLPEFGADGQERLLRSKVAVVGAGGLGCPILIQMALAGVGQITVIDFDRVELSNLHRQPLYTENDIGQLKSIVAKRELHRLNPDVLVSAISTRFEGHDAIEMVKDADLVIDACDNLETRYLINDICIGLNIPFVSGSIHGFQAQVGLFNFNGSSTYRCAFPDDTALGISCSEIGVLGVVPSVVGALQAAIGLKVLGKFGGDDGYKLLLIDFNSLDFRTMKTSRNERAIEHARGKFLELSGQEPSSFRLHQINGEELIHLLGKGDIQLLDVREPHEKPLPLKGAVQIPLLKVLAGAVVTHDLKRGTHTVVYCQGGNRSLEACKVLTERDGFEKVVSLRGGLNQLVKDEITF